MLLTQSIISRSKIWAWGVDVSSQKFRQQLELLQHTDTDTNTQLHSTCCAYILVVYLSICRPYSAKLRWLYVGCQCLEVELARVWITEFRIIPSLLASTGNAWLPPELWVQVFSMLSSHDIKTTQLACRSFFDLSSSFLIQKSLFRSSAQDDGRSVPDRTPPCLQQNGDRAHL